MVQINIYKLEVVNIHNSFYTNSHVINWWESFCQIEIK